MNRRKDWKSRPLWNNHISYKPCSVQGVSSARNATYLTSRVITDSPGLVKVTHGWVQDVGHSVVVAGRAVGGRNLLQTPEGHRQRHG